MHVQHHKEVSQGERAEVCRLTVGLTGATLGEFGLVLVCWVCSAQVRSPSFSPACVRHKPVPSTLLRVFTVTCFALLKPLLSHTDHSQLNSPPLFDASNWLETSDEVYLTHRR